MSSSGGSADRPELAALGALERAVETAAVRLADLTRRVEDAELRSAQLQELVGRFTGDAGEAGRLLTQLGQLDDENTDLRARLEEGRAGVDRLLAKIRFLEGQQ